MTNTIITAVKDAYAEKAVVVFNLAISSMSADRQIDLGDLGVAVESLPAATKKLVEEKIFPKSFLRPYDRLRERAVELMEKGGSVKVALGTVTSKSEAVEKINALDALKAEWAAQLEEDGQGYDKMCHEHITSLASKAIAEGAYTAQVHQLTELLIKKQPTWEQVKEKMSFAYMVTPISLDEADFDPLLFVAQKEGIVALREGVMGALIQYVCREANELMKVVTNRNAGKSEYTVNGRTAERIKGISQKLHSLSFIHDHIKPLADAVDEAVRFMPASVAGKDVRLTSGQYHNLVEVFKVMSDQILVVDRLNKKLPFVTTAQAMVAQVVATTPLTTAVVAAQAAAQPVAAPAAQGASAPQASAAAQPTSSAQAPAVAQSSPLALSAVDQEETQAETEAQAEVEAEVQVVPAPAKKAGRKLFL